MIGIMSSSASQAIKHCLVNRSDDTKPCMHAVVILVHIVADLKGIKLVAQGMGRESCGVTRRNK